MSQATLSNSMRATRRRETVAGYIFMAPSLLFFLGFVIFPMGMCLVTSFFNYTMSDFSFIGLNNYKEMVGDPVFVKALVNTIVIVVVSVWSVPPTSSMPARPQTAPESSIVRMMTRSTLMPT